MDDHIYFEAPDYTIRDFLGNEIKVGDRLIRAIAWGNNCAVLERRLVTKISKGMMFLDNSNVPIKFPDRCLNLSYLRTMDSHLWETKV